MALQFWQQQSKLSTPIPLQISGCQLWLNAGLGITKDGSDNISAWADQSGNGNHATQINGINQPKFIASSPYFNNKPAILFDGSNDFFNGTTIPNINTSDFTLFVVNYGKTPKPLSSFFEINTYSNGWLFGVRDGGYGYNIYNNNDYMYIYEYTDSGDLYSKILSSQKDYTTKTDILVGGQIITSSTSAVLNGIFTNANYKIGLFSGFNYFNGYICDVLLYNRLLTDGEKSSVNDYFATQYKTPLYLTPKMTSANAPSGIVTASASVSGLDPFRAFDYFPTSFFSTGVFASYPQWIKYQLPVADICNALFVKGLAGYGITAWKVQGSNDDTNWTDLDNQTGQPDLGGYYQFTNNTSYLYYRILISNGTNATNLGIVELYLLKIK
jgi:hypothetical protein